MQFLLVSSDQVVSPMAMEKSQKWGKKSLLKKFDFLIKFSFFSVYMEKWHILLVVTSNVVTHTINTFHHQKKNFCSNNIWSRERKTKRFDTKDYGECFFFSVIKINNDTLTSLSKMKHTPIVRKLNLDFWRG